MKKIIILMSLSIFLLPMGVYASEENQSFFTDPATEVSDPAPDLIDSTPDFFDTVPDPVIEQPDSEQTDPVSGLPDPVPDLTTGESENIISNTEDPDLVADQVEPTIVYQVESLETEQNYNGEFIVLVSVMIFIMYSVFERMLG